MKKIFTICFSLLIFICANAQNIQLTHNGVGVSQNDTIIINTDTSNYLITVDVRTINPSNAAIDVMVNRTDITVVPGSSLNFCWDQCYAPFITLSPTPVNIPAGSFTDKFKGDYTHNYNLGTSLTKYRIFDSNDSANGTTFYIKYNVTGTVANINTLAANKVRYYYNNNMFSLLNVNNQVNSIDIYSINGKKIISSSSKAEVDISVLNNGLYLFVCDTKKGVYKYKIIKE